MQSDKNKSDSQSQSINLEKLLEERERLEELIKNRFTRKITVMFTDFKGSTSIAETEGDVFSRMLIKKHNDIVFPILEQCQGVLVKTMGDGTLSYFENPSDAIRAAIRIQKEINAFNLSGKSTIPIHLRIGMHTGTGIVEKHDIFGDVVNVASRFETLANPGEIYLSESTFHGLHEMHEFYCRHIQTTTLKGKKEFFKIYKAFWDEKEIEEDRQRGDYTVPDPVITDPHYLREKTDPHAVGSAPVHPASAEDSIILQKAHTLREGNELLDLYLYCEEFMQLPAVGAYQSALRDELERNGRTDMSLNGKKATWFFRDSITIGRLPEADFPLTNQALTRVPITIGVRKGEGVLKVEGKGTGKIHKTEVLRGSRTEPVLSDIEYPLGREGKIILAVCFPLEYRFYKGRFLILNIINPEECVQKHYNIRLRDVWKGFDAESERFLIIGR